MMRRSPYSLTAGLSCCLAAALLAACASAPEGPPLARAELRPASGSQVAGWAIFVPTAEGVRVAAALTGLPPGEHGFHIHEVGDCSAADATSAKGHFNPLGARHGHVEGEHHLGDMPNIRADELGNASYKETVPGLTLDAGPAGILGRAVIVHADADDYMSQPAGNSGRRVACGVIRLDAARGGAEY